MLAIRPLLLIGIVWIGPPLFGQGVTVTETTILGDMDCFEVRTPAATYVYGKRGAGLARMLDRDGNDWVGYRHGGKAAGEYRGMPKCGQPTKFFHCGYGFGNYATDNPFESVVESRTDDLVRIRSRTVDGRNECVWDFHPSHATFTLVEIANPAYWFLYEGTPGGKLNPAGDAVIRPDGTRTTLDTPWNDDVEWALFTAVETDQAMLLVDHTRSPGPESYVAWPYEREPDGGFQQMTVFGFGRPDWKSPDQHSPPLTELPATFSVVWVDGGDGVDLRRAAEQAAERVTDRERS